MTGYGSNVNPATKSGMSTGTTTSGSEIGIQFDLFVVRVICNKYAGMEALGDETNRG